MSTFALPEDLELADQILAACDHYEPNEELRTAVRDKIATILHCYVSDRMVIDYVMENSGAVVVSRCHPNKPWVCRTRAELDEALVMCLGKAKSEGGSDVIDGLRPVPEVDIDLIRAQADDGYRSGMETAGF